MSRSVSSRSSGQDSKTCTPLVNAYRRGHHTVRAVFFYCLNGCHSQCGGALGGWKFGNTINGAWAEYLLVPDAKANLAPIPRGLADEDVLLCPDIFSTGLSGAESGNIKVGDSVAVFAGAYRALCDARGKAEGRIAHHRDRFDARSARSRPPFWRHGHFEHLRRRSDSRN